MTTPTVKSLIEEMTKPRPLEVVIAEPRLKGAEVIRFWMATALIFQLRTAAVWAFLAIFFPQFGATWIMVMFGLWALRHVVPTNPKETIKAIASTRR